LALPSIYSKEHVGGRFDVDGYWDRSVQIDVVGLRDDGWVDLGECRWVGRTGLSSAARELAGKMGHFPDGNRTVRQLLFVGKKPASIPAGVLVHDLQSLYL
jgi:uncharacterized protein